MSNRRLNSSNAAQATRTELARAGKLGLTTVVGEVPAATPRRRVPSMPRVTLDNRPTKERTAKAPDGIEAATGTKAHRVRNPLEVHKQHFAPDLIAAATHWLRLRESVDTANRVTAAYQGGPSGKQRANPADQRGGVPDQRRADAAELAYIEATIEEEFHDIMELIAAGVDAHRHNQPRTVADIARRCLAYRSKDGQNETAAGVGMLWGWMVRLKGVQIQIRATRRTFSTAEEIAIRLQERRRQAATAQAQFRRERGGRDDEAA
jgi:hypothetical protein